MAELIKHIRLNGTDYDFPAGGGGSKVHFATWSGLEGNFFKTLIPVGDGEDLTTIKKGDFIFISKQSNSKRGVAYDIKIGTKSVDLQDDIDYVGTELDCVFMAINDFSDIADLHLRYIKHFGTYHLSVTWASDYSLESLAYRAVNMVGVATAVRHTGNEYITLSADGTTIFDDDQMEVIGHNRTIYIARYSADISSADRMLYYNDHGDLVAVIGTDYSQPRDLQRRLQTYFRWDSDPSIRGYYLANGDFCQSTLVALLDTH